MSGTRGKETAGARRRREGFLAKARKPRIVKPKRDETRERRISMEIVVDTYKQGRAVQVGWNCYLDEKLSFPLSRPLRQGTGDRAPRQSATQIEVIGMASEDECQREIFVVMRWESERTLAVPLSLLEVADGDKETRQAVKDWLYWVDKGYEF